MTLFWQAVVEALDCTNLQLSHSVQIQSNRSFKLDFNTELCCCLLTGTWLHKLATFSFRATSKQSKFWVFQFRALLLSSFPLWNCKSASKHMQKLRHKFSHTADRRGGGVRSFDHLFFYPSLTDMRIEAVIQLYNWPFNIVTDFFLHNHNI